MTVVRFLAVALVASAGQALAADPQPDSLYEISTDGSSARFKVGEQGRMVLEIRTKQGAHVSNEAPLKVELSSAVVTLHKSNLTLADSTAAKKEGQEYADPRFEVGLSSTMPSNGSIDAKLTFFICTDKLCARQQKSISVPVEVISPDA